MASFQDAAGQSSASRTVQGNQALLEPNTCIWVNLCSFKEARFTVPTSPQDTIGPPLKETIRRMNINE